MTLLSGTFLLILLAAFMWLANYIHGKRKKDNCVDAYHWFAKILK